MKANWRSKIYFSLACLVISGALGVAYFAMAYEPNDLQKRTSPQMVLANGRLAALPQGAKAVQAAGWSAMFTGAQYLMFTATPAEIKTFLADSPSLKGVTPEQFSSKHQYVLRDYGIDQPSDHSYFSFGPQTPSWYRPVIEVRGRKFLIPAKDHHNWGEVVVDDEKGVVYVEVIWS